MLQPFFEWMQALPLSTMVQGSWGMQAAINITHLLSLVFFFSYGPLEAALPVYSSQALKASAGGYGLLWTGFGVGAFAGVLTLTRLSHRWRPSAINWSRTSAKNSSSRITRALKLWTSARPMPNRTQIASMCTRLTWSSGWRRRPKSQSTAN